MRGHVPFDFLFFSWPARPPTPPPLFLFDLIGWAVTHTHTKSGSHWLCPSRSTAGRETGPLASVCESRDNRFKLVIRDGLRQDATRLLNLLFLIYFLSFPYFLIRPPPNTKSFLAVFVF